MHDGQVDRIDQRNAHDHEVGPRTAPADNGAFAAVFAQLAVELHDARSVDETVQAVVEFALQALNCDYAGVALRTQGRPEVPAVTDPTVAVI